VSFGSKGSQEVVQTSSPWGPQIPYLAGGKVNGAQVPGLLPLAAQWLQSGGPQFYPNSTVAPLSPAQTTAMQGIANRAVNGSPLETAGQGYATDVLRGGAGNDMLNSVFADIQNRVGGAVGSTFEGSGRTGSPLHAINLAQELARAYSPFAFGAAENNANRQQNTLGMVPQLAGLDYNNLNALLGVGQMQQQQGQAELQDAINRWNQQQNQPLTNLQNYQGLVSGNYGGTITQPSYTNPAAGALGGAASGAGIGMMFGPWGAGIGAGLGGLLGLLG
jgi:hypothetical protein